MLISVNSKQVSETLCEKQWHSVDSLLQAIRDRETHTLDQVVFIVDKHRGPLICLCIIVIQLSVSIAI